MANNFTINIEEGFDVALFAEELAQRYQAKGYQVICMKMKNGANIVFKKGLGGINTLLGLGVGITVSCSLQGKEKDILAINFSNAEWTSKITGLIAGWFLCMIPVVTAIIGILRQNSLPEDITNDIQMSVGSM